MNQHMALEVRSSCGGVIALCASKRLLTTMNQHMVFQIARLIACVVALVTAVELLSIIAIERLLEIFCIIICLHCHVFFFRQVVRWKVKGLLIIKSEMQTEKS